MLLLLHKGNNAIHVSGFAIKILANLFRSHRHMRVTCSARGQLVVFLSTVSVGLILCARLCLFCLRDQGRGFFHNGCVIGAQPGVRRRVGAQ